MEIRARHPARESREHAMVGVGSLDMATCRYSDVQCSHFEICPVTGSASTNAQGKSMRERLVEIKKLQEDGSSMK
jgi:hypothetical protein